ncbi:MAG: hypothetical protein J6Z08_09045 [Elusimicrobiales bacterium]|nr:hypothetical protein [Elusimicrobiales bacterium]
MFGAILSGFSLVCFYNCLFILSQESHSPGESIDKDLIDIIFDREKIKKGSPETIAEFAEYLLPRA